jgi:UDP-N-acetylmuramoylalanine--D-glutamate ligase
VATTTIDKDGRNEFQGRRVAVLGVARTGLAAAPVLRALGAHVLLSDSESDTGREERAAEMRAAGIEVVLGANVDAALGNAEIVVPSPGIPRDAPVLLEAQRRGLQVLAEIEVAYRISQAPILSVTGTNGKTTCAAMLHDVLKAAGRKTHLAGNIAADDLKLPLITAAAAAGPDDVIVAEISSFQLEWVERFRPKVGILTNVTPDHLNRHPSFADYAACKGRMFAAQGPDDVAVIKAVNAPSRTIADNLRSLPVWFDRGACYDGNWSSARDGRIVVFWRGREYEVGRADTLLVPGIHNLENALAVAGAAIAFGIPAEAVDRALHEFRGVAHRMEMVDEIRGVVYINNSMCTNVEAAVRSLEAVHRPTVLIAGGGDKGLDFAPLGIAIRRYARSLVLIGETSSALESSARSAGFDSITRTDTLENAALAASKLAHPGDAVMLAPACTSFGMFKDFEARGQAFRVAVRALSRRT